MAQVWLARLRSGFGVASAALRRGPRLLFEYQP